MNIRREFRTGFLNMLKHTLNPVTRQLARTSLSPFAIVQHVGRRSGKRYETPIIVSPVANGLIIELTYGKDVDWHKNIVAAGGCTITWHGKQYVIDKIEPLDTETGRAAFPMPQQAILKLLGRTHFEKLSSNRERMP